MPSRSATAGPTRLPPAPNDAEMVTTLANVAPPLAAMLMF
jgi:hypothetical protein